MLRKIIAVDKSYADRVANDSGHPYFPARDFLSLMHGEGNGYDPDRDYVDIIEALCTVVEMVPGSDSPEDWATVRANAVRQQHALEDAGYRVIYSSSKRSQATKSGYKSNEDQLLMIHTLVLAMRIKPDFLALVAGDGDYAPFIWQLRGEGIRTEVIAHPTNLASDLRRASYNQIDLLAVLERCRS